LYTKTLFPIKSIDYDYHEHEGRAGGGIASYVNTIGQALVARGHQVTVIAGGSESDYRDEQGIHVVRVPLGNLHWYFYKLHAPSIAVLPVRELEWSWTFRRQLDNLLAEESIDVVEGCETGFLFVADMRGSLPPLIVRLHGEDYVYSKYGGQRISLGVRVNRQMELIALRRAAACTSPSRFHAEEVARDLGWSPERTCVIPNPISPGLLAQALSDESSVVGHRSPVVLYTGRIEHRKGTLPLLRSIPRVAEVFPEIQYVIVGGQHTSIDDRTLNKVMSEDNIGNHVRRTGYVPWQQLLDWYRRASVFVMPSYYEVFGISVIEAMAFGLPVVATTAGGLPEVVEDGVTGILVPPGDSRALADAIMRLLHDPSLRRRMGEAGRERVLAEFTVDRVAERTIEVYTGVLERHNP
jgi:glycosyltransferase involved in cell wall biosynthesis